MSNGAVSIAIDSTVQTRSRTKSEEDDHTSKASSDNEAPLAQPKPNYNDTCRHFKTGYCKMGAKCRFVHGLNPPTTSPDADGVASPMAPVLEKNVIPPSPTSPQELFVRSQHVTAQPLVNLPHGCATYALHVEYVATGAVHTARSIAQIALADGMGRPIFNVYVKQSMPILSYRTALTGLTEELLETHGISEAEALALLRAHVPHASVLIGANIVFDVSKLQLMQGVDYAFLYDLTALFKVWDVSKLVFQTFSMDHCASVWIGVDQRQQHNAVENAAIAMSLFNAYRIAQWDPPRLYQLQMATLNTPRLPSFSTRFPTIDGCCMGSSPACRCGASTAKED